MSRPTIYLISITILTAISILVLRYLVRRDYLQRGQLRAHTSFLQALVFFVYGGFPCIYLPGDWPAVRVILPLRVVGLTSLTTGLFIIFIGIYRLGILRSLGLQTGELKETSYYHLSRNPQVVGCSLYVIGFLILWPSWYALGWGISLLGILHAMVLIEEEHLHHFFGQDFEQYCKNVPRYIEFPKKKLSEQSWKMRELD